MSLLKDIKVVAFTQFLLGPIAVQYLTDLGADAVKVERPDKGAFERGWAGAEGFRNGMSLFYALGNRNIRSVTLDLKSSEGKKIALEMISQADVVVQNYRPGGMERLGLDYESLKSSFPQLIYATASGYGATSELPGQDLLLQAQTGIASVTGTREQPSTPAGTPIVDQHSASLLALGILAALFERTRTGKGRLVEVDMVAGGLDLQTEPFTYYLNDAPLERPGPSVGSTFHQAPYGVYSTSDGEVAISMVSVPALGQALGYEESLEEYTEVRESFRSRNMLGKLFAELVRPWSAEVLIEHLRSHGLWCAPVQDYAGVMEDRDINVRERVVEFTYPNGTAIKTLGHPLKYDGESPKPRRVPPDLGTDTSDVLAELGYSSEEVDELKNSGVI
ncbi:CaiB/BaiF CoA transferase family protein [Nesterenkonia populi]